MLLVVGAVVAVVVIAAASFLVVRGLTGDDDPGTAGPSEGTGSPDDGSTDLPTDQPTDGSSDGTDGDDGAGPVQCDRGQPTIDGNQRRGRTLSGGGLSMPTVDGYRLVDTAGAQFTFADGAVATVSVVEQSDDVGWVSEYALGGLNRDNEFGSPEAAARTVLDCIENSDFYASITGSSEVDAVSTTIDGADAFVLTEQIDVDEPELSVTGDIAQIAVVDTGDEATYGLYVSIVPLGDQERLQQQATQLVALEVD